jgi:hypothetical protein
MCTKVRTVRMSLVHKYYGQNKAYLVVLRNTKRGSSTPTECIDAWRSHRLRQAA